MTATQFRSFTLGDGPALVELWQRSAPRDSITLSRLRNMVLLDPNFRPEGLRIATSGERLIGAAYGVTRSTPMEGLDLENDTGWIPFFFVDPAERHAGVGTRLLSDVLLYLKGKGRTKVHFASYTPYYFVPGLDRATYPDAETLLHKHGFEIDYECVAMDLALGGYKPEVGIDDLITARLKEDYSFSTPTDDETYALASLASETFNPDWGRAIRTTIQSSGDLDRIIVARDSGRIVGWAMHGAYEDVLERFGPFGVDPAQRGKGLGKVLLHLTLQRMQARGLHGAWFLWTGEKSPAGHLYLQTGFTISRSFAVMSTTALSKEQS